MKYPKIVTKFLGNELFVESLILLILINFGNLFNYLYQFFMARMLGPIDYGTLAVLTNIIYIFSVPTTSIQTVVSKYTTRYLAKKQPGKLKWAFNYALRYISMIALVIFLAFVIISIFISPILNISFWLLVITGLFLFGSFIYPIGIGILQGSKKFRTWGWNYTSNSFIKFTLAVLLVWLGFGVYGAILGSLFGVFIAFLFILPFIKEITSAKEKKEKIKMFSKDNLLTFGAMLILVLMYSIDVILAKSFFAPEIAGKYAVLSLIGKIILFAALTIGNTMFPISSERFVRGNKEKTKSVIRKTYLVVIALCIIALSLFFLMPDFIIKVLFGSQYTTLSNILWIVGIAFSLFSLVNIRVLYLISIDEFKLKHLIWMTLLFAIQLGFMYLFKSNINEFSLAFMYSSIVTFIGSIIFLRR